MTYDPTAAYRSSQVTTSSPVAQVVLLYEGAIRFASLSVVRLEQRDLEGSHNASLRAQAIVSSLRASLDLSAGDVATRLDSLYEFMTHRLVAGNLAKDARPAQEVIGLLRELLAAWRTVANPTQSAPPATALPSSRPGAPQARLLVRAGYPGAA